MVDFKKSCNIHRDILHEKLSSDGQTIIQYCLICEAKQKLDQQVQTKEPRELKREYFKEMELIKMLFIFTWVVALIVGSLVVTVYMFTGNTVYKNSESAFNVFLYIWIPVSATLYILCFARTYRIYKEKVHRISSPEEYANSLLKNAEAEQEKVQEFIVISRNSFSLAINYKGRSI